MRSPDQRNRPAGGRLENVSGPLLVRRFSERQPETYRVIEKLSAAKLASDEAALCELAQTAMDLEYDGLEGDFLQAGLGLGGAAIVLAHAKRRSRPLYVCDPFSAPDSEARARRDLAAYGADERLNVRVLAGAWETVPAEGPLALAHLDVPAYEPMRVLLERLSPRLAAGGHFIVGKYKKDECRRAVDEYFRGKSGFRLERRARLHAVKA